MSIYPVKAKAAYASAEQSATADGTNHIGKLPLDIIHHALAFLRHPGEDSRFRETCRLFRKVYPVHAHMDMRRLSEDCDPRFQDYVENGAKIHSIDMSQQNFSTFKVLMALDALKEGHPLKVLKTPYSFADDYSIEYLKYLNFPLEEMSFHGSRNKTNDSCAASDRVEQLGEMPLKRLSFIHANISDVAIYLLKNMPLQKLVIDNPDPLYNTDKCFAYLQKMPLKHLEISRFYFTKQGLPEGLTKLSSLETLILKETDIVLSKDNEQELREKMPSLKILEISPIQKTQNRQRFNWGLPLWA